MSLVILDRDGVINFDSKDHIRKPDEWEAIPGSLEAIAKLSRADFRVIVATNQSGIGRGLFDIGALNLIHQKMTAQVREKGGWIDAIFFCPHTPEKNCTCRKPKPGLLLEAGERLHTPLHGVPFVGDSRSDIAAAHSAGAQPILVKTGNGLATYAELLKSRQNNFPDVKTYENLSAFVESLISAH
jgi:D-glycero-D-manno-heptose 1,7-bisphosphate phosphatase